MLVGVASAGSASASVAFVQGTSFDNASGAGMGVFALSQPVNAGDLLVGWFAQWGSAGDVQVSDNVDGTGSRAPDTERFGSSGDIALYYLAGSKAAAGGITITVSATAGAGFQGAVAQLLRRCHIQRLRSHVGVERQQHGGEQRGHHSGGCRANGLHGRSDRRVLGLPPDRGQQRRDPLHRA